MTGADTQMAQPGAKDIPLFWAHGKDDDVVKYICKSLLIFPFLTFSYS
jgi:hypothetical protein